MRLALGTVQFGLPYGIANQNGQIGEAESRKVLRYAFVNGINTLDTAISYGESESRLGEFGIGDWNVVTKLPELPHGCLDIKRWVAESVRASLERMKIKRLYGLLLHRPLQLLSSRGVELFNAMQSLKSDGLIEKAGVSIYGYKDLDLLAPYYQFDLVQAPFNPLDQSLASSGWMNRMYNEGTELHVRSLFLQGLLLLPANNRPKKFSRWANTWSVWDGWLKNYDLSPLEACIGHAISFKQISKILVGVDSAKQLKEIIDASQSGRVCALPGALAVDDEDLINPSRWSKI